MLRELKIRNLVIIESADLAWGPGFTAVTGETGAGKSVLMGALKFILGGKVKPDIIRQGADKLKVEAIFDLPPGKIILSVLEKLGIEENTEEIILERELTSAGKNRCRVNGSIVTTSNLEELGTHLVDLHGQHQQQSLLNSGTHLGFLDGFAFLENDLDQYAIRYRTWKSLSEKLITVEETAKRVREQYDFLKFQFKELEKAPLGIGEEERIETDLKMQSSLEKIKVGLETSLTLLDGEEGGILPGLSRLKKEIHGLEKFVSKEAFENQMQALESAHTNLAEVQGSLSNFRLPQTADATKLDELNAKLALIQRLKAKYHTDMAGLLEIRTRRQQEIGSFENSEALISELKSQVRAAEQEAFQLAKILSQKRLATSKKFEKEVNDRLHSLAMEGATFKTHFTFSETLLSSGIDQMEFFLSSNAGETSKPLKQIASGGEISRIMLAIKAALAQSDPRPLLVFDELDTGIGGVTANRVGELLKELAGHHQLIVITHLHQVAAQASQQQRVVKELDAGRTITRVIGLSAKERVQELARMMGDENSNAALKHAKELLTQA